MQNNKLTTGILFIVILLIGIVIGKYLSPHNEHKIAPYQQQEKREQNKNREEENPKNEDSQEEKNTEQNKELEMMTIYVPEIGTGGAIRFKPFEEIKSPAVLNTVYRTLFSLHSRDDDNVWNGVSFDSVSIDTDSNGKHVAKVQLSHSWIPDGDMSGYVFRRLIDAAAFQYPNIDRVEVYINGNPFDWCIDDMSDGESGCSTHPKLWSDDREYYANHLVITY